MALEWRNRMTRKINSGPLRTSAASKTYTLNASRVHDFKGKKTHTTKMWGNRFVTRQCRNNQKIKIRKKRNYVLKIKDFLGFVASFGTLKGVI